MAYSKKLIHFKKKKAFENQLKAGNILDTSIVFIKDSRDIYTHGEQYKTVTWRKVKALVLEYSLSDGGGEWVINKEHNITIKRTSEQHSSLIQLNIVCEGGTVQQNNITDDGSQDWQQTFKIVPTSEQCIIKIEGVSRKVDCNELTSPIITKTLYKTTIDTSNLLSQFNYDIYEDDMNNYDVIYNNKVYAFSPYDTKATFKVKGKVGESLLLQVQDGIVQQYELFDYMDQMDGPQFEDFGDNGELSLQDTDLNYTLLKTTQRVSRIRVGYSYTYIYNFTFEDEQEHYITIKYTPGSFFSGSDIGSSMQGGSDVGLMSTVSIIEELTK